MKAHIVYGGGDENSRNEFLSQPCGGSSLHHSLFVDLCYTRWILFWSLPSKDSCSKKQAKLFFTKSVVCFCLLIVCDYGSSSVIKDRTSFSTSLVNHIMNIVIYVHRLHFHSYVQYIAISTCQSSSSSFVSKFHSTNSSYCVEISHSSQLLATIQIRIKITTTTVALMYHCVFFIFFRYSPVVTSTMTSLFPSGPVWLFMAIYGTPFAFISDFQSRTRTCSVQRYED